MEYKKWDAMQKKMITSATPQKDYQPRYSYTVMTDKGEGIIEFSERQMGDMLVQCFKDDKIVTLTNKYFSVKWNGKEGLESRYWLNKIEKTNSNEIH